MKTLLITHVDLDGVSPVILLNLANIEFTYKLLDLKDIDEYFDTLFKTDINEYDTIYVVDLSLTEHVYDLINEHNINIKVFDHHETHLFANSYDYVNVSVDINGKLTCGTELFYNYLISIYPNLNKKNIKYYVELVRQLDTYTFESEIPRQLETIRSSLGNTNFISSITKRLKKDKDDFQFTAFEKRLLKIKKTEQENYIKHREEKMKIYTIDNKRCGVVFAERYKSDIGNYLATKYNDIDIVIIIDSSNSISYRAVKDDVNVSLLAAKYNGGGHKHASGSLIKDEDRDRIVKYLFEEKK